jgi:hypothetical protein
MITEKRVSDENLSQDLEIGLENNQANYKEVHFFQTD